MTSTKFAVCGALLAAMGCSHPRSEQPITVETARAPIAPATWTARCDGPVVIPAGTRITARLDESLRFSSSYPGQRFTAAVVTPVRAGRRCEAIPRGALIEGSIAAVSLGATPTLRLAFDRVDTVFGARPVMASLERSQQIDGALALAPARAERGSYDAVVQAAPERAIGGGPRDATQPLANEPELPVGSDLHLVLDRAVYLE
jgi:hypothetical protein